MKPRDDFWLGFLPPLIVVGTVCLVLLTGCANTMQALEGSDAACADIEVDGYLTDSRARGRILKLPEGQELTPELAETLWNQ